MGGLAIAGSLRLRHRRGCSAKDFSIENVVKARAGV